MSQLDNEKQIMESYAKFRELAPGLNQAYDGVRAEVYKDGALSLKVKRLMSLATALMVGCTGCILAQCTYALEAGATRDEILETCSVAVSMGGTTAVSESCKVIQQLDERGML